MSGSGKSALLLDVLAASAQAKAPRRCEHVAGLDRFGAVRVVDQAPLGRGAASTPATYTGLFDTVRKLFARTEAARRRKLRAGRFAYTGKAGQCPDCKGQGQVKVALDFLADLYVPCEACGGARYEPDTLSVTWRGHTIADILRLTADQALEVFGDQPTLRARLELLERVGLGYLRLGQPTRTLSGGEAQRLKLVSGLTAHERCLYLLDEPTRGLHPVDVARLVTLLHSLVDAGHTVVVVEHDLDVVRSADWVVDLGPEGGEGGGHVVVAGTPERVARCGESHTGAALRA